MLKSDIKPGTEYALREKRTPGGPVQRVRILEHVRGNKWKAEWVDPNPGLIHYVESSHLISTWKELRYFLREEEARRSLRDHNESCGYVKDSPLDDALYEVFENAGGEVTYYEGVLSGDAAAVDRLRARARTGSGPNSPRAYTDKQGTLHLPFDQAVELARAFCAAEPAAVLVDVEVTERRWTGQATRLGEEHTIGLLNRYRAAWALIRQWAGQDAALAQHEAQIQRLERMVWDAVYALQRAGLDSEAAKLRRRLESAT